MAYINCFSSSSRAALHILSRTAHSWLEGLATGWLGREVRPRLVKGHRPPSLPPSMLGCPKRQMRAARIWDCEQSRAQQQHRARAAIDSESGLHASSVAFLLLLRHGSRSPPRPRVPPNRSPCLVLSVLSRPQKKGMESELGRKEGMVDYCAIAVIIRSKHRPISFQVTVDSRLLTIWWLH